MKTIICDICGRNADEYGRNQFHYFRAELGEVWYPSSGNNGGWNNIYHGEDTAFHKNLELCYYCGNVINHNIDKLKETLKDRFLNQSEEVRISSKNHESFEWEIDKKR